MLTHYISNAEVGDTVYKTWGLGYVNGKIATVTRLTKTRIYAEDDSGREHAISRKSGKEIGGNSYWYITDEPDKLVAEWKESMEKKHAANKAREDRYERKLFDVKADNPDMKNHLIDLPLGLKGLTFKNKNGDEGFIVMEITEVPNMYRYGTTHDIGYEVTSAVYGKRFMSDEKPSMGMPNTFRGGNLNDVLAELVGMYWD